MIFQKGNKIGSRFQKGENGWLGKHHSETSKEKIRKTFERDKIGFQKGYIPWNKGMKMSKKYREKLSESQKGRQGYWKGKRSPNWKGGRRKDKNGYIYIYKPSHRFCTKQGCIFEHRLVAEKYLGRYLTKQEVIHHINEIQDDNRPENLYLFPNPESHTSYHILLRNKLIQPIIKSNLIDSARIELHPLDR